MNNDYNFSCNPNNLIIGGGSGEHPAIVLTSPDYAVAQFITTWIIEMNTELIKKKSNLAVEESLWNSFIDNATDVPLSQVLQFINWSVTDYYEFYQRCTSSALCRPYSKDNDGNFELWLASNLGEFIFFAMPELAVNLHEQFDSVKSHIKHTLFRNVLVLADGYPI